MDIILYIALFIIGLFVGFMFFLLFNELYACFSSFVSEFKSLGLSNDFISFSSCDSCFRNSFPLSMINISLPIAMHWFLFRIPSEIADEYELSAGKHGLLTREKEGIKIIPTT